jgi:rod shape-determining protein MreC
MLIRQEIRLWLIHFFYGLFFIFLLHRLFFPSFGMAERCMSYALYPFLKIHASLTSSLHQKNQASKTEQILRDELEALYIEHDVLKGRLMQLEIERRFLSEVQELSDFAQRYQVEQKNISKVLMRACSSQEDIMFIEGGKNKKFAKDDMVVYQQALVGRIVEVYPWYSKVILATDQRCRIASQISEGVAGICCGGNDKKLKLCFVPHFKTVSVGDLVVSTGQGLLYPQGFVLGVVTQVQTDLVSHDIVVKPAFDIDRIEHVYVLRKAE